MRASRGGEGTELNYPVGPKGLGLESAEGH